MKKNTAQHTPGPWTQNADTVWITDRITAVVKTIDSKGQVTRANNSQDVANARLISCAPFLLSSLIELENAVFGGDFSGMREAGIKARAAIAAATQP